MVMQFQERVLRPWHTACMAEGVNGNTLERSSPMRAFWTEICVPVALLALTLGLGMYAIANLAR